MKERPLWPERLRVETTKERHVSVPGGRKEMVAVTR